MLADFENDLIKAISNVKFNKKLDGFQAKLQEDVKRIRKSTKVIVEADKTSNLYELTKDQYLKLLRDNVTTNYQKAKNNTVNNINREAKDLASELELSDRVRQLPLKNAFVTLKDHKPNFDSNPKCRLLNPTKSEIGIISKKIISNINNTIRNMTNLIQWTNTDQVINWFNKVERGKYQFIKFDVVEFYPSISKSLLRKALSFAKKFVNISELDVRIINNATKSVLLFDGSVWSKRRTSTQDDALFDITMGGFHGAEICELVGLYMLNGLTKIIPDGRVGLYRDDGLGIIPKQSGSATERLKKDLHAFAKSIGLRLEIEEPSSRTEYLDIVLDLDNLTYSPYRKPNNEIRYINIESNHPKSITSRMKTMIEDLISRRSCNKNEFDKVAEVYSEALINNGYEGKMTYQEKKIPPKKQRKRAKIWFNPPYCKSVKDNIGKIFIGLVKKHFHKGHPLHNIINNHKIGFSYSCMPSMKAIIASHNKKILEKSSEDAEQPCNCQKDKITKKTNCPMKNGSCRTKNIVYKATIKTDEDESKKFYIGLASTEFKLRWYNHRNSFKDEAKKHDTAMAKHIWKLKEENKKYAVSFQIIARSKAGRSDCTTCRLCLKEAAEIIKGGKNNLNRRNEITGKCRHMAKYLLKNWKETKKK